MDRVTILSIIWGFGFPRRRGDGPDYSRVLRDGILFPPQARGWTGVTLMRLKVSEVSPAGAGMDRSREGNGEQTIGFPRRRGDGPLQGRERRANYRFPPQARGWTAVRDRSGCLMSVSPAGAGMDPRQPPARLLRRRFPRRRGDGPMPKASSNRLDWFPPQARGWTAMFPPTHKSESVSPAGAGMDPSHPRRRP